MATPPDFSVGQVLTAAHMDAVGLWLVGSATSGSGVTTLEINDVFSADYEAYRIVLSGGSCSAQLTLSMQFITSGGTPSTTGYYETFIYSAYNAATVAAANTNNGANFVRAANALGANEPIAGSFDLINPFAAKFTHYYNAGNPAGGNGGNSVGYHGVATSYTGLKFTSSVTSGLTTVNVRVYGYRN